MRHIGCLLAFLVATPAVMAGDTTFTATEPDRRPTIGLAAHLYGDNTEFLSNPYRDGDTLLGATVRLDGTLPIGWQSLFRLGVQTDSRAGGDKVFRKVFPVIALEVGGPKNRFTMGTLHSGAFGREPSEDMSPDLSGPHGLVPPLHLDTLALGGYEAGLQWQRASSRLDHDIWIAWRRTVSPTRREKFDVGLNSRAIVYQSGAGSVSLLGQGHIVHEGGQVTHAGAVGDSIAGGPGLRVDWYMDTGTSQLRTELFVLFSKHNPDRADDTRVDTLSGYGRLLRVSYLRDDWRIAYLRWHNSRRVIKWDGDPNYGVLLNVDTAPGPVIAGHERHYDEFSVSRRFQLSSDAALMANGRLYRVDGSWDYAYRVAASIRFRRLVR